MPTVNVKECDSFEVAARRFKRACEKAGILTRLRQLDHYEKPTTRRKRKAAAAVKRYKKKLFKEHESLMRTRAKHPQRRIEVTPVDAVGALKSEPVEKVDE